MQGFERRARFQREAGGVLEFRGGLWKSADGEDVVEAVDALQLDFSGLVESELVVIGEQRPHRVGHHDLAAACRRRDARCLVHRHPQIVTLGCNRVTNMQPDSNRDRWRVSSVPKRTLDLEGGSGRGPGLSRTPP